MDSVEYWRRWGRKKKTKKKERKKQRWRGVGIGEWDFVCEGEKKKRWKKKRKGENVLIVYMDEKIEEWKNKIKN